MPISYLPRQEMLCCAKRRTLLPFTPACPGRYIYGGFQDGCRTVMSKTDARAGPSISLAGAATSIIFVAKKSFVATNKKTSFVAKKVRLSRQK